MSALRLSRFLDRLAPEQLGALLRYENSQVGALILAQTDSAHGAAALPFVSERRRNDLVLRLSTLDTPNERALPMLENSIPQWKLIVAGFGGLSGADRSKALMACLDDTVYSSVRDALMEYDPDLGLQVAPSDDRGH